MMPDRKVEFELVSPERLVVSDEVDMVVVPGIEGDFGVLHGHAAMISTVRPGVVAIFRGGKADERVFVAGGFAEVTPTRCTVLAEDAVPLEQLDRGEAEQGLRDAQSALSGLAADAAERGAAEQALAIAEARYVAASNPPYGR